MTLPQRAREELLNSEDFFYCSKYEARMSKASCRQRQKYARLKAPKRKYNGHHKIVILPSQYAGCLECGQGKGI
jgi:hypothetical protein